MTLTTYENLTQGSEEWIQARAGILTASVIGQLITPAKVQLSKSDTARSVMENLLAERLSGHVDEYPMSADMERGVLDEPYARDLYASVSPKPVAELGFMVLERDGRRLGYSPDALVGDNGLGEIKSRKPKIHLRTILDDRVPADNMAQLQTGLYVSGREWIDYISYAGGWPLHVIRVYPDQKWFNAIEQAVDAYETFADLMTETFKSRTEGAPIAPRIDHYAEKEMTF